MAELEPKIGAQEVVDHFQEVLGDPLVRVVEEETVDYELLEIESYVGVSSPTPESEPFVEKYGVFTIHVFKRERALEESLRRDDRGEVEPDEGIFWHWADAGRFGGWWTAHSRYRNLMLTWYPEKDRTTDTRWERLNSILAELAEEAR